MRPASKTTVLTTVALLAFAANSLLCRSALGARAIDGASFTLVRLASGALVLAALVRLRRSEPAAHASAAPTSTAEVAAPLALFAYAMAFSLAYLRLTTATGALVLFGSVQIPMIVAGLRAGERPRAPVWLGAAMALAGLVGLTFPGLGAPDPLGAPLMALAGAAWGVYSLRGRGAHDPLAATARNFARAVPLAVIAFAIAIAMSRTASLTAPGNLVTRAHVSARGILLAASSGTIASGLGYAVWYSALRGLTATRAAIVQLAVPVIAAIGGVALLGEPIGARLVVAAAAILGGVGLAVLGR